MDFTYIDEMTARIRDSVEQATVDKADEEAGLGPSMEAVAPPGRRGSSGAGIADAISTAVQRGGETFVNELTAPVRDIPEGIQQGVEAIEEDDPSVLGRLRRAAMLGLGGAQAGLSLARPVFAPVTAAARTATELPMLLFERPQDTRPANAETARQVAEAALSLGGGIKAAKMVGEGLMARRLAKAKAGLPPEVQGPPEVLGPPEPPPQPPIPPATPGESSRWPREHRLPDIGGTYEAPGTSGKVFVAGPPGSVSKNPRMVTAEEFADDPGGRFGKGKKPTGAELAEAAVKDEKSVLDNLRQKAREALGDKAPDKRDLPYEGKGGKDPNETTAQYLRRLKREKDAALKTQQNPPPPIAGSSEPSMGELYPEGKPPNMPLDDWVKLHTPENRKLVQDAAEMAPEEQAALPQRVQDALNSGSARTNPDNPDWLRGFWTRLKIKMPLSMTQIAKGDPLLEKIVQKTVDSHDAIQALRDDWVTRLRNIAKTVSKEDFEGGLRARDRHLPPANPNQGQVATLFGEIADAWAKALSLDPTHPKFVENYVPRLRHTFKILRTEIIQSDAWMSRDVLAHFPTDFKPYFTKSRRLQLPGERYDLDTMIGHANAVAHAAVYGTPQHHGFLKDLEPLLKELKSRPPDVQDFFANYLNYAVGHPAFRSSEMAAKIGGMVRTGEFMRTIGGSITSPIYNAMQRALTFSEVGVKSFAQAFKDEARWLKGDPELVGLVKKARLPTESLGPHKLETETAMQGVNRGIRTIADKAAVPFGFSERGNRVHAFFAGYRDALSKGAAVTEEEAIEAGRKMVQKTQFMPGPADKPRWMRGEVGGTIGQFKYFQTKLGEYMWGNFSDMLRRGATYEERLNATKKFVKFWGTSYALGGPQVAPLMGDWLEKHDPVGWKGLGPILGVALTDQLGMGAILPKDVASLKYYLPGPVVNHAIDILNASGIDIWNLREEPKVGARARAATRSFPLAGVQLERLRKWGTITPEGVEREPQTAAEAWPPFLGGTPIPPERPLLNRNPSPIKRFIGLSDPEQEKEYRAFSNLKDATVVKNRALRDAAQARAVRDFATEREILRAAETELGLPVGTLEVSPQSIKAAKSAAKMTPLERLRKSGGKSLRHYGEEDTMP